jgi:diaminopimelate epimerase
MKKIKYFKYHALGNDFLILDLLDKGSAGLDFNDLSLKICHRRFGAGGDGILVLTGSDMAMCCVDIFNSDGSWAEKSGNGLRIGAAYYYSKRQRRKKIEFEINGELSENRIIESEQGDYLVQASLGRPGLTTSEVPLKSKKKYHINEPLNFDGTKFPITALSVGNPHAVMFVDSFDFDWKELGAIIENSSHFPHRTNVEFVRIVNRSRIILNDWERGAGATGSSGTGAAAAVVAGVINGYLNRRCEVVFPSGSLFIDWQPDDIILLTGPVCFVGSGEYQYSSD